LAGSSILLDGAKARLRAVFLSLIVATAALAAAPSVASAQNRTLKLYFIHTGEKAEIVYKRNGAYDQIGLNKINQFLRDWRRNEPARMDPKLLDLVWEVYQKSGSSQYIHIVSAYRSPATNGMLRKRSRGVAKNSQHMLGKAMDFFIPDVPLAKLREAGLKVGAGGVGYYPTSGSPFVHMDTGSVRHWPRMNRQELVRIFPDGKTMHVPSDGKPLPGYEVALAAYEARKSGKAPEIVVAEVAAKKKKGFFERFAAASKEDEADEEEVDVAAAPRPVKTASIAPQPAPGNEWLAKPAARPVRTPVPAADLPSPNSALPGVELPVATDAVPEQAPVSSGTIEIANVPIPEERPNYVPPALVAEAIRPERAPRSLTAALSAEEIETLRRTAVPADSAVAELGSTAAQSPSDLTLLALADEEEPVGAQASLTRLASVDPSAVPLPSERPASRPRPLTVASISPLPEPRPEPRADQRTLELALAATRESNSSANEAIRALIDASGRLRETTSAEPRRSPPADDRPVALASFAAEEDSVMASGMETVSEWSIWDAIGARNLADQRPLVRIDDVRAPAYGMGVLRKAPDRVLLAGFVDEDVLHDTGNFSGSSLISADFASFDAD